MQTAVLLVVLAAIGGIVVVRTVLVDHPKPPKTEIPTVRQPTDPESAGILPEPDVPHGGHAGAVPVDAARPAGERRPRRLLTASALTDTLSLEGEEELQPTFFGRTLAFGRLLLVILFICALAGGTLFWVAMMIATRAHIHPG